MSPLRTPHVAFGLVMGLTAALAVEPAHADEPATDLAAAVPEASPQGEVDDAPRWRRAATLYGWVPNFKGDVSLKGVDSEPSLTRSDILDNLDIAFMGRFETGRVGSGWSFWTDVFWSKLQDDDAADLTFGPRGKGRTRLEADFEARMSFVELGAAKHLWRSEEQMPRAGREPARTGVDLLFGARYARMRVKAKATLTASTPFASISRRGNIDDHESWIDPFVGARLHHGLAPDVWLLVRGDVGGFGVGADLAWTATATVQWFVSDQVAVGAGWKIMDLDYEDGGFEADVRMSGPFVTLTFGF